MSERAILDAVHNAHYVQVTPCLLLVWLGGYTVNVYTHTGHEIDCFSLGYDDPLSLDRAQVEIFDYLNGTDADDTMDCGCTEGYCSCEPMGLSDVEADAMTLASAGWGTDEDYGYAGDDYDFGF